MPKRLRPIKDVIAEFEMAVASNDFDRLCALEDELDVIVKKRVRQMRYKRFPAADLKYLIDILPEDYNTEVMRYLWDRWEEKTPAERAG